MKELPDECCAKCKWWQNYHTQIEARISTHYGSRFYGHLDLRICEYSPPPNVQMTFSSGTYTDEGFCCSQYIKAEK